jgi:cytochrome P450 family 135
LEERALEPRLPAGPRLPGFVQTGAWGLRPFRFFDACRRRFGPTFTVRFYDGRPIVVASLPADLRTVFALGADEVEVGAGNADILEPFLGARSVLVLDGEDHRQERRRLQHAFHAERVDAYRQLVATTTRNRIGTWPLGTPITVHTEMRAITLDVILHAVFGADDPDELQQLRGALAPFLADSSGSVFVLIPPFRHELGGRTPWARFVRQRAAVHHEVLGLIGRRRNTDLEARHDMLSALLRAGDAPDGQLLDELMTLVLAGHDTTATALAWAFDLLAHHPAELDRLRASLDRQEDDYLDAVVHETLRLRPVTGEVARTPLHPLNLTECEIPAGTSVMASIHLAHTDPARYDDPLTFRPERFLDRQPDLANWLPFGGGIRRCLGAGFATLELRETIRQVVTHATFRAATTDLERPKRRAVTMIPRHGTRIVVNHRRPTNDVPSPTRVSGGEVRGAAAGN